MSGVTQDLRKVAINQSFPKVGFLKAVTAQHAIIDKLSTNSMKPAHYFDTKASKEKAKFKTLSKVQEFHFDQVLEEVLKLRQELKEAKDALQVKVTFIQKYLLS